jgi:hypothetical protein
MSKEAIYKDNYCEETETGNPRINFINGGGSVIEFTILLTSVRMVS